MKLFILIALFFSDIALSQDLPDLSDTILVIKKENSNYYYLNTDTSQVDTFYYDNSHQIHARGKHFKTKRNGNWLVYYPSGQVKTIGYVTDSSFYGKWSFFHENGKKKAKGKFKYAPDEEDSTTMVLKMSGKWRFWGEDGRVLAKKHFSPYRSETESKYGKQTERYPNRLPKSKGEYHKGVKIGKWTYYHDNGKTERKEYYTYKLNVDGTYTYPVGTWFFYDRNGILIKKQIYKDGQLVEDVNISKE